MSDLINYGLTIIFRCLASILFVLIALNVFCKLEAGEKLLPLATQGLAANTKGSRVEKKTPSRRSPRLSAIKTSVFESNGSDVIHMETGSENTTHNKGEGLVVIGEVNIDMAEVPLTSPRLSEDKSSIVGIKDGKIVIYQAREDGAGKEWGKAETQGLEREEVESFGLSDNGEIIAGSGQGTVFAYEFDDLRKANFFVGHTTPKQSEIWMKNIDDPGSFLPRQYMEKFKQPVWKNIRNLDIEKYLNRPYKIYANNGIDHNLGVPRSILLSRDGNTMMIHDSNGAISLTPATYRTEDLVMLLIEKYKAATFSFDNEHFAVAAPDRDSHAKPKALCVKTYLLHRGYGRSAVLLKKLPGPDFSNVSRLFFAFNDSVLVAQGNGKQGDEIQVLSNWSHDVAFPIWKSIELPKRFNVQHLVVDDGRLLITGFTQEGDITRYSYQECSGVITHSENLNVELNGGDAIRHVLYTPSGDLMVIPKIAAPTFWHEASDGNWKLKHTEPQPVSAVLYFPGGPGDTRGDICGVSDTMLIERNGAIQVVSLPSH